MSRALACISHGKIVVALPGAHAALPPGDGKLLVPELGQVHNPLKP